MNIKIKVVRKGKLDWVTPMEEYIGDVFLATKRSDKEKIDGVWVDVYDAVDECSNGWTWYSDAVEEVSE